MPVNEITVRRERGLGRLGVVAPAPTVVRRWADRMLSSLDLVGAELSIVLCDDAFIRDLNRRFADEDHATDVLAFATTEGPGPRQPGVLGDVVISIETAARQAAEHSRTTEDEIKLLLAHGLLHLLGYDHRMPAEERIMTAKAGSLVQRASTPRRRGPARRER